ncbi:hypothetical protein [Mycobacterium sp.]|uniref:hypothetical protein n=1 Tax=Mycobacterium sp. TaxID=1785 RepID=UPI0025F7CA51|nr:hypothetical protein [Mycobacterium sp.]
MACSGPLHTGAGWEMPAPKDRRGRCWRAPQWARRALVIEAVCALVAAAMGVAGAAPARATAVLRVGTYQGIPGQFSSIQDAVNAAQPGDWILIGPGDYHETGNLVPPGLPDTTPGSAVLVTTPNIWIRGMDRNRVVLDGTKPGAPQCSPAAADQDIGPGNKGRQGIQVYEVNGVSIENLTVCNFLSAPNGGPGGNEIWFNGGHETGKFQIGSWRGAYLSATSTYWNGINQPSATYGLFANNTYGPGLFTQVYANNQSDSAFYIGACPNCNSILDHAHGQNSAQGYAGTNSGGHLIIQYSEFDNNRAGFSTNSQNNADPPSPQDGSCPNHGTGPTGTHSCWVFWHNTVHDNNNPNVPAVGEPAHLPIGTGVLVSGGRFDTVVDNNIYNNGSWGVLLAPDVSTRAYVSYSANCHGGLGARALNFCYYDDWGNEVADNTLSNNGTFGNPSNGDLAEMSNLHLPGNCFHGNVDGSGATVNAKRIQIGSKQVTTAPPLLQFFPHNICGIPDVGAPLPSVLGLGLLCASEEFGPCPTTPITKYPEQTVVQMMPLPAQPTLPDPCLGVPRNPWCPNNPVSQPSYPVPGSPVS